MQSLVKLEREDALLKRVKYLRENYCLTGSETSSKVWSSPENFPPLSLTSPLPSSLWTENLTESSDVDIRIVSLIADIWEQVRENSTELNTITD